MDAMKPHEVSEADWVDELDTDTPPKAVEPPTLEEAGDAASLRDDAADERIAADEQARLADAEARGTGGSW
jgi:hypothetical protein